jgi:hypothetical protein
MATINSNKTVIVRDEINLLKIGRTLAQGKITLRNFKVTNISLVKENYS